MQYIQYIMIILFEIYYIQYSYIAETESHIQTFYGSQGYLGTILDENENECLKKLGYCDDEDTKGVWAGGEDNHDNHKPHQWYWRSVYGPDDTWDKMFYVVGRPNDIHLGYYSDWDTEYDQPDMLHGTQHHLTVCNERGKWADENWHSKYEYLVEYSATNPKTPPRIFQVIGLDGGASVSFSEPLMDGGSKVIECKLSLHPIPELNDILCIKTSCMILL